MFSRYWAKRNRAITSWAPFVLSLVVAFLFSPVIDQVLIIVIPASGLCLACCYIIRAQGRTKMMIAGFFSGSLLWLAVALCVIALLVRSDRCFRALAHHDALLGFVVGFNFAEACVHDHYLAEVALRLSNDPPMGQDPYSGKQFRRSERGIGYSIGPDFVDDNGLIIYDPTNGLLSRGDIREGWKYRHWGRRRGPGPRS